MNIQFIKESKKFVSIIVVWVSKQYKQLADVFSSLKESAKVLFFAVVFSLSGFYCINHFLIPSEKNAIDKMSILYQAMGSLEKDADGNYVNENVANDYQNKINDINLDMQMTLYMKILILGFVLGTFVSLIAWWILYCFTDITFKGKDGNIVMAVALLCACIIVSVIYYASVAIQHTGDK